MKLRVIWAILFFLFIIIPSAYPQDSKFIPFGYLEVLGTYSDIKDGSHLWGYNIFGYYSPTLKINDSLYLIPLYTVEYKRLRQFISQEEGTLLYNTYMAHNFNLALRKEFKEGWFLRFAALGTWNYVKETRDESWGEGLYDYRDVGCSLKLRRRKRAAEDLRNYTFGFEYFRRIYPNFQSLISIGMPSAPETNEKDFDGFKLSFSFDKINSRNQRVYLKPYLLFKVYLDKHLIRQDGTLDIYNKREDRLFNLDYGFKTPLNKSFYFGMDNNYTYNYSNLGFYDSKNTLGLGDDAYLKHYYSYHSASASPYIEYIHRLDEGKEARLKLGYSILLRYYPHRKAQNANAVYGDDNEEDLEQMLYTSFSWPLTKSVNLLLRYSYTWARSNQEYEEYYRYNYDTYRISSGLSFEF
ncbi:MAG: hypothetical protein GF375_00350 [Candidatus Omnitrophica bacterium]|nr:hypothetical protein [Candidatus Omnitrophota bacterium]MBD3268623.1 hypothetical protein [Candidatus Omnitrophota bacterium]